MIKRYLFLLVMAIGAYSCTTKEPKKLLVPVSVSVSNIDFINRITENDSINVVDFQYCYNGGGVGIGDFDNDGWPDVVFTGNQVQSKIYLNKKNLQFEDITEVSGLNTNGSWVTGVTVIDINSDGLIDIYLSVAGPECNNDCDNLLFINQGVNAQGIPKFKEQALAYGLNDGNYSQQSVFFDYDSDGDLDVFILHNGNYGFDKNNPLPKRYMEPHLNDLLLRNDSVAGLDHPFFTDISKSSGIVHGGFGLGVGINDINKDGLTDIYVANDFITEDLLYVQRRHKDSIAPWFEELSKNYISHASHNGMGVDFADINNDALPDIVVADMMPEQYDRQKKMLGSMNYERYLFALRNGYGAQYVRNTLQLNNGFLDNAPVKASEVGYMAKVTSTDWSWAPLMIDLDNDADKDLYISNGYVKDVSNLDYINYSSENNMFGSSEDRLKKQKDFAGKLKSIHLSNYIFENLGEVNFKDVTKTWTTPVPSFTNGVAYADFDKDGDIDLILNNINEPATLLNNTTSDAKEKYYLRIELTGPLLNISGIGADIEIWVDGIVQSHYQSVVRGYLSSVEPIVHFGVKSHVVDSIKVRWPNNRINVLKGVKSNQVIKVSYDNSKLPKSTSSKSVEARLFKSITGLFDYKHKENNFNEYALQPLLMRQYAQMGPCTAAANINTVLGDEVFIGGSKNKPGQIWAQDKDGNFQVQQQLDADYEDTDAIFIDVDNDLDLDLIVTSGGTEFGKTSKFYADRLYRNNGAGFFDPAEILMPNSNESTQLVRPFDFDNDGDLDLFLGARIVPGNYPDLPVSKILKNDNGKFVTLIDSGIDTIGMITDALWCDVDKDDRPDLIVVGEWMPITVYKNNINGFSKMVLEWVDKDDNAVSTNGWWNAIAKADFDGDGDLDFLVGNQGLNSILKPTQSKPVYLYKNDFDRNGSNDPIIGVYAKDGNNQKLMPLHSRDDIVAQLPKLKRKYLRYDDFTKTNFQQILGIKDLKSQTLSASMFSSSYVENLGSGKFKITELPQKCQVAPINDILIEHLNQEDGLTVLLVGNDFTSEAIYGRADGLTGITLEWYDNNFEVKTSKESGFYVPGQSNHLLKFVDYNGKNRILASQNNDSLQVFSVNN